MLPEPRKVRSVSKLIVVILVLALVIGSAAAIYLVLDRTGLGGSLLSVEALSVASSSSNLTASLNLRNSSAITRMSLFINGTFVGSYNNTHSGWGCCFRLMQTWSNGTSSYYFSATPHWMPMMGHWNWGYYGCCGMLGSGGYNNRTYIVTMMATFADGRSANSTVTIVPNQQGTGWRCR